MVCVCYTVSTMVNVQCSNEWQGHLTEMLLEEVKYEENEQFPIS